MNPLKQIVIIAIAVFLALVAHSALLGWFEYLVQPGYTAPWQPTPSDQALEDAYNEAMGR